jgi:hypothetical protein
VKETSLDAVPNPVLKGFNFEFCRILGKQVTISLLYEPGPIFELSSCRVGVESSPLSAETLDNRELDLRKWLSVRSSYCGPNPFRF